MGPWALGVDVGGRYKIGCFAVLFLQAEEVGVAAPRVEAANE